METLIASIVSAIGLGVMGWALGRLQRSHAKRTNDAPLLSTNKKAWIAIIIVGSITIPFLAVWMIERSARETTIESSYIQPITPQTPSIPSIQERHEPPEKVSLRALFDAYYENQFAAAERFETPRESSKDCEIYLREMRETLKGYCRFVEVSGTIRYIGRTAQGLPTLSLAGETVMRHGQKSLASVSVQFNENQVSQLAKLRVNQPLSLICVVEAPGSSGGPLVRGCEIVPPTPED